MEKRAKRELRKIHATAEESANRHAQQQAQNDRAAHELAMVAHFAQRAMAAALAAGATTEEAISTRQAASKAVTGACGLAPMHD